MGNQSGATADTSGAYQKGSSKTQSSGTQNTNYSKTATFGPEGQGALSSLGGAYGGAGQNQQDVANYYRSNMNGAAVNPYYAELAKAQGAQADQAYAQGMKGVRSAGYGKGIGQNYIDQSKLTANFANAKASNEANLLAQAFNMQQQQKNSAAAGLQGQNQDVLNFLSLLRGESGAGTTAQSGTERTDNAGFKLGQSFGFSKS